VTWGEVRRADPAVRAFLAGRIAATLGEERCTIKPRTASTQITRHSDGAYAVLPFSLACPRAGNTLSIDYAFLFEVDPQHRGVASTPSGVRTIFSKATRHAELPLGVAHPPLHLGAAVLEGVHHIWTGYDHLLFLVALLLPAVLRREDKRWVPVENARTALVEVLKVVTAFTLAHSVTLSLAALGVLSLPSAFVESAIALSVVLAAVNNLWPMVRADRWLAAFALGLLHGFGFSATLVDLGLDRATLLPTLVGFNLGVELGQAALVAVFVPIAFVARRRAAYRVVALQLGSVFVALIAAAMFFERAFGVTIFPRS
jgi:hypothetical protein